ncbi:rod shape-determining protein MreC [Sphingomonas jatrophae]|uniref:Cell shape-determining protein MreC n=1 Tax=Sphingomonas jatrophae TaxID=1166337 RepID=A0A1I6M0W3_9SPHN|nr:rod shape-determining protein MreC [Sphingomonas jatrophae]SFS09313.1 rod shape-determining protein MreC [Sphingomonas jatrophae]
MRPPRRTSPGFSRRAQFGLFAAYVAAVAGVVIGLALVVAARVDPRGFALIRGAAIDAIAPLSAAGRSLVERVSGIDDALYAYVAAGTQNRALRAENMLARRRLIAARGLERENRRLRALLRLAEHTPDRVATARIVGSTASGSHRLATLTAGSLNGVRPGHPVRAPEGLVGRVLETGATAARVLLLADTDSSVPVLIVRNGQPALASGRGDGRLTIRPLVPGPAPFRRGDVALTSGTGGLYPPGIPVAVVDKVDRDGALAWPLADPARLDFVMVEPAFAPPLPPPAPPLAPPAAAPR